MSYLCCSIVGCKKKATMTVSKLGEWKLAFCKKHPVVVIREAK